MGISPKNAPTSPQEIVPFSESGGRIAAESLAAYPPGVPNVLPGERQAPADVTADTACAGDGNTGLPPVVSLSR